MSTASWKNQGGFSKHRNVGSVTIRNQKDLSTLNLSLYNHPPPLPDEANYNAGTIVFSDNKLYFKNSLIGWDLISSTGNTAFWSKYLLTTKIYYDQGFVGIGSNSEPMATLDVCGNVIIRGTAIGATGLFTLHGGAVNEKWNAIELISNENGYGPTGTETVIYFSSNDHKVANSESLWHIGMKETGGDLGGYDRFFIGSQHWESEGAGEECLTIAKTGNVGIGATGPTQTLDVSGNVKILGALYDSTDTSGTAGQVLTSTITGTLWAAGGGGSLWTENGSDIYYNTGNVGINNATPGYTLDVGGTVHFSEAIIGAACSGATYSTALGYQSTATGDYATAIGYQANTGTGYAYSMGYRTKAEGFGAALGFRAFADEYQFAIGVSQNLSSATIPDAADNENVLTIRATGPGTSSSTNRETDIVGKLNVTGDAIFTNQVKALSFETNGGGVYFDSTATEIKRDPSSGLAFITGVQDAIKMTIDTNGNVGIGATGGATGTSTLFVNGEIRATGDIISFWSSDNRLKTNLEKIEDPLEKLKQINGYTYDWIDNPHIHSHSGRDVGVIAQELDTIGLTGIVAQRDNGYMAVNYDKIIPLLIECIKSQQEQLNKQQEQINALLEK